ncbi:hypothetical protein [Legionella bononiensis]|uniref:Uncharacterized protein n=1 Tax=Legionella bononiensis TaxID=2793102 RepID=A0ABS1WBY4_9GAMM|nr:hypothetical protein [Legionella bononiensis]MBL7481157.1 hypothetical protein [Legionella bononiensis]MBL7526866.1 hypothetical protein [Legionella bononiensis]MBL7564273.1 hypothetical protein [Legionella bononiensis]
MKKSIAQLLLYITFSVLITPTWAEARDAEPTSVSLPYPSMTGPLVANSNPYDIEIEPLGTIDITGTISGLGLWQNNPVMGNPSTLLDIDNGQLFIQKIKGLLQFYVQAGG